MAVCKGTVFEFGDRFGDVLFAFDLDVAKRRAYSGAKVRGKRTADQRDCDAGAGLGGESCGDHAAVRDDFQNTAADEGGVGRCMDRRGYDRADGHGGQVRDRAVYRKKRFDVGLWSGGVFKTSYFSGLFFSTVSFF